MKLSISKDCYIMSVAVTEQFSYTKKHLFTTKEYHKIRYRCREHHSDIHVYMSHVWQMLHIRLPAVTTDI